jgi:hypothetical protein
VLSPGAAATLPGASAAQSRSKAPDSLWAEIAARARGCYMAASPALAAVLRDDFEAAYV